MFLEEKATAEGTATILAGEGPLPSVHALVLQVGALLKAWLHSWHSNGFCVWYILRCQTMLELWTKVLLQSLHAYGCSLVKVQQCLTVSAC